MLTTIFALEIAGATKHTRAHEQLNWANRTSAEGCAIKEVWQVSTLGRAVLLLLSLQRTVPCSDRRSLGLQYT